MNADRWWKELEASRPVALRAILIPPGLRVAVLGPHPDDFDAIGITLRLLRDNGNPIHVAVLSSASGVEDCYCTESPPTPEFKSQIRVDEQRRSCRFFGLPDENLVFPDMDQDEHWQPVAGEHNAGLLRTFMNEVQPDLVFLPHGNDGNAGHQATFALLSMAVAGWNAPLAAFYIRDPKTISMRIDAYTPFSEEDACWKAELLRFHDTQQQRNLNTRGHGLDIRILEVNRSIAAELGLDAPCAEGFQIEIIRGNARLGR